LTGHRLLDGARRKEEAMAEEQAAELRWEDLPQYMEELRTMARALLRQEGHAESVQVTSLMNAALQKQRRREQAWETVTWENRYQFFGFAHRAMRQVLIDRAKIRHAEKRTREVHLDEGQWANMAQAAEDVPAQVLALHQVLEALEQTYPEWVAIVEYRYYSGLTYSQIARIMGKSEDTIENCWRRDILPLLRKEVRRIVQEE